MAFNVLMLLTNLYINCVIMPIEVDNNSCSHALSPKPEASRFTIDQIVVNIVGTLTLETCLASMQKTCFTVKVVFYCLSIVIFLKFNLV